MHYHGDLLTQQLLASYIIESTDQTLLDQTFTQQDRNPNLGLLKLNTTGKLIFSKFLLPFVVVNHFRTSICRLCHTLKFYVFNFTFSF